MTPAEKKAKRRMEREEMGLKTEARERGIPKKKKQRMRKEKRKERKAASVSASPTYLSDVSQSDDSEEDMILCPAESCLQPAGDEVCACVCARCACVCVFLHLLSCRYIEDLLLKQLACGVLVCVTGVLGTV